MLTQERRWIYVMVSVKETVYIVYTVYNLNQFMVTL